MILSPSKLDNEYKAIPSDDTSYALENAGPSVMDPYTAPPSFADVLAERNASAATVNSAPATDLDGFVEVDSMNLPPPDFTTYPAEFTKLGNGNIVSHDPHLNEDGEALYRFLLSKASVRPQLLLHCRGTHQEYRTRTVTRYRDGKSYVETETYTETIVDFDFYIDATSAILPDDNPVIWSIGDMQPAYRGKLIKEVDNAPIGEQDLEIGDVRSALVRFPTGLLAKWRHRRRKATREELRSSDTWEERRKDWGLPPWVAMRGQDALLSASLDSDRACRTMRGVAHAPGVWYSDAQLQVSNRTLRDWADEYCASNKILKEFTFQKVLYGWNMQALTMAINTTIRSTAQHDFTATFTVNGSEISVRPDSMLSRALTNTWVYVFLWITLIFPIFIWPFRRFHPRGGGDWRVCGNAFALTRWKLLHDSIPGESVQEYEARVGSGAKGDLIKFEEYVGGTSVTPASGSTSIWNGRTIQTTIPDGATEAPLPKRRLLKAELDGVYELEGTREGEWFKQWEDTLVSLVATHYQSTEPLYWPQRRVRYNSPAIRLDGYL